MLSASSPADLHIANNLRLAANDLKEARILLEQKTRGAAYHAEQAIEKLLLAILISEQIHVPVKDTHQLDTQVDKLPPDHPMLDQLRRVTFLTIYATAYRYPKTGGRLPPLPDWSKIDSALIGIEALIEEASKHFGVDLTAKDTVAARNSEPMRHGGRAASSTPKP